MLHLVFSLTALIGLFLTFLGAKRLLQFHKRKVLMQCELRDGWSVFEIHEAKEYTLYICGGHYVSDDSRFGLSLQDAAGNRIRLTSRQLKQRSFYKRKQVVELANFTILSPGTYTLEQRGSEYLKVKASNHPMLRIFMSPRSKHQLSMMIRERVSGLQYLVTILMLVFGLQIAGWGMVLAINPFVFY